MSSALHLTDACIRARYLDMRGGFCAADVELRGGVFTRVTPYPGDAVDLPYLLPGLFDIHTHGNSNCDFSMGDIDGLVAMARYLYDNGILSFCGALMTLPEGELVRACECARRFYKNTPDGCARLAGITLEGPFLSMEKRGAQAAEYLTKPDYALYSRLQRASGGLIKLVCVAPELEGAREFISRVSQDGIKLSLAHTACGYDTAAAAFDAGASHITHLYNAMPPMLHRAPGPIPAAVERERVTAELICDGLHVHPSMVRAAYRLFGANRLCLISDAMAACGMGEGEYTLGSQRVVVKNGSATLADGTLAGSCANLWDCMKNAVEFGIPLADAVRMASITPAETLGFKLSRVKAGEKAAHVLCDAALNVRAVLA